MSLMIDMLKNKELLSGAERVVLEYLINNKTVIKEFSVEKIAEATFTSAASVVRMCKKLGYKGFKDFKVDFIMSNAKIEISSDDEYSDIILMRNQKSGRKAIENNILSLEETLKLYDEKHFSKAAALIMNAKKILIVGNGSSYLTCKDFEMKLRRINKLALSQSEGFDQLIDASFVTSEDVIICVSNSGTSKDIISAALLARENRTPVISVVKAGISVLADISDVVLYTSSLESDFRSAAMTSRISQMTVIDALFVKCAYLDIDKTITSIEKTYTTISKYKK